MAVQTTETVRSRFLKLFSGEMPADRLPVMEWVPYWQCTLDRWHDEGLPLGMNITDLQRHFGLDVTHWHWHTSVGPTLSRAEGGWVRDDASYDALRPQLYPDLSNNARRRYTAWAEEQARGDSVVWFYMEGFFWWPRQLLGIERHLFAFHDAPELMHRMNADQADYILRVLDEYERIGRPDVIFFGEDLSYNHGPMISRALFEEFIAPYYARVIPRVKELGMVPFIDSDGAIEDAIDWFAAAGLEGASPLERACGADVNRVRAEHPDFNVVGGFDKRVIGKGEAAIREEFERLLPAMRSGRYVPSVDHQTPPDASLENYRTYCALLHEYAARACEE